MQGILETNEVLSDIQLGELKEWWKANAFDE